MTMRATASRGDAQQRVTRHLRTRVLLERADALRWPESGMMLGMSRASLISLFRDEEEMLDALNDSLVAETRDRLRAAAEAMEGVSFPTARDAARALVQTVVRLCPLDRSGLLIRLERRARDLRSARPDPAALRAERRLRQSLQDDIGQLLATIGRAPLRAPVIVTRVLLGSYERALEAWLMSGGSETDFGQSRFVRQELPALALALSTPTTASSRNAEE